MKVYFSHGKESGPWGSKIKRLADIATNNGFNVESIDYSGMLDPDKRVKRLIDLLENEKEDVVLVGSSMGGYVSLIASEKIKPKGLFLLAPALYIHGYEKQSYKKLTDIEIVHGWSDEVIPPENSIRFAKETNSNLHLIDGDHRLNSSLHIIEKLFSQFLNRVIASKINT